MWCHVLTDVSGYLFRRQPLSTCISCPCDDVLIFLPINYTVHFWVYLQGRGRNNKFDPLHQWYLFRLVENNYTCRLSKRKKERRSKVSSAEQYICKKNLILIFENALTFAKHERKRISGGGIVVVLGAEGSFLGLSVLPLRFLR
jgi:hypothetical protein